jgi:hypothetical protein
MIPTEIGFIVKLNSDDSLLRQRFTCAHEIAHTFLFQDDLRGPIHDIVIQMGISRYTAFEETLCHLGASEILMPFDVFRSCASRYDFYIAGVSDLASLFQTSIPATAIRMGEVNPKKCHVLIWREHTNPVTGEQHVRLSRIYGVKRRMSQNSGFYSTKIIRNRDCSVFEAFNTDEVVYSEERLDLPNVHSFCEVESKRFGYGKYRQVITFAYPKAV